MINSNCELLKFLKARYFFNYKSFIDMSNCSYNMSLIGIIYQ